MQKPGKKDIHLWLVDERAAQDAALTSACLALLNDEEKVRQRRFLREQHRQRFLLGRALLRSVLSGYDGLPAAGDLSFETNAHGKPALTKALQSSGLQFNLSHTQGLIALAVVQGKDIGVDVEFLPRKTEIDSLAQRYFSPQEWRELDDLDGDKRRERFFDLWTLKEAYVKACGQGLSLSLEEFSFRFEGKRVHIAFSPQRNDSPERWRFWQLKPSPQHRLAIALCGKDLESHRVHCRRGLPTRTFLDGPCEILRSSD